MKNLKILNDKNKSLKEKNTMKKIISSALVFTLMGVSTVSGAFASDRQERCVDNIVKLTEKMHEEPHNSKNASRLENILQMILENDGKLSPYTRQRYANEILDLMDEATYRNDQQTVQILQSILNDIVNENENQNSEKVNPKEEKIEVNNIEDKNETQISKDYDKTQNKTSTAKKVLIATLVIALVAAVGGYAAYTYCPAVKTFIDSSVIPNLSHYASATKDFASNKILEPIKDFVNCDAIQYLKSKAASCGSAAKTLVNDKVFTPVKGFVSSKVMPSLQDLKSSAARGLSVAGSKAKGLLLSTKNGISNYMCSIFSDITSYITSHIVQK